MGIIRDVKDWFNERGDDIFGIDRKVEELIESQLLPKESYNILSNLEKANREAENNNKIAGIDLKQVSDKRKDCYKKLIDSKEEFRQFKKEHYGIIAKFTYNLTPLRFFSTGREYQRLRREIKNLKTEHKFWTRLYDESTHIFEETWEYRKETKRTLAEYKRIIVNKAKEHKNELKLIKEYNKLRTFDQNKLKNYYGEDFANNLISNINYIKNNWFNMKSNELNFDVKDATKAIISLRKNKSLSDDELNAMRDFGKSKMNQSKQNQGPQNQGPQNQGPQNQGPQNQGPQNQGPQNQGPQNQGSQNQGSQNLDPQNQDPQNQVAKAQTGDNKGMGIKDSFTPSVYVDSSLDRRIVEQMSSNPEKLCEELGGIKTMEDVVEAVRKGENLEKFDPVAREFGKDYVAKEKENQSKTDFNKDDGQLIQ